MKFFSFVKNNLHRIATVVIIAVLVLATCVLCTGCQGLIPLNDSSGNVIVTGHDQVTEVC